MLNVKRPLPRRRHQQGLVLVIALIVLVLVSLGGLALMRSVDTTTLVAGNLAFQQAATRTTDIGVEKAVEVLAAKAIADQLNANDTSNGYFATLTNPASGQSWPAFWTASLDANSVNVGDDGFGNNVKYVIQRQCANALPPSAGGNCVYSPNNAVATGNGEEANSIQLQGGTSKVYYRITVRVTGPRRTETYVQSHVAM